MKAEPFQVLNFQSVSLQPLHSPPRLDYGQFRQEPAITGFDGLFTPIPRLEEQLSLEPLQASTLFYESFALPWDRSLGFGLYPSD